MITREGVVLIGLGVFVLVATAFLSGNAVDPYIAEALAWLSR